MINSAILMDASKTSELFSDPNPEHVELTYDANGQLQALRWQYCTKDRGMYQMVKRRGGVWRPQSGGWTFKDLSVAEDLLKAIVKKHPDWPIIGHPSKPFKPLAGIHICRLTLSDKLDACFVPIPLPPFWNLPNVQQVFKLALSGKKQEELGLLISSANDIDSLVAQGAICDNKLSTKWSIATHPVNLHVKVSSWAVEVTCDLSDPRHYSIAPEQNFRWEGAYPFGTRVAIPWGGKIYTTRKLWPALKSRILEAGLRWDGDDPETELSVPATFDANRVAGWFTPAPNGHLMHAYQKTGAEFCTQRGMRALVGDEMGVGKTVQAIAAAEACGSRRILVICPANARYVWDSEIRGWGGKGAIQHITSQSDSLDLLARWHIVTYDLIAARATTWRFKDESEEKAFVASFPALAKRIKKSGASREISLDSELDKAPAFDLKRVAEWEQVMRRLRGALLQEIMAASPLLTILDEAHRVKNKDAKRTQAIQKLAAGGTQILMLTGTPLRNNEHEAAVLLGLLDTQAATALSKEHGYTIQDVKDYLSYFMIRRTKADVLPELPEKTRQRIDIVDLDPDQMEAYQLAIVGAQESYSHALSSGKSEAEARQGMQGGIERARTALGVAKVRGGAVCDLVLDVVENKGCCVVFCAHHQASDNLKALLEKEKLRVAVVDGRTKQKDRAALVNDFQEGKLDVFIGGINAAGEAITLTRADTVIFVELDWVPAALRQAEDRIHRVGQQRNCQVIQLIAKMKPSDDNLDEMMVDLIGSKVARIGSVLDEDTANIIAGGIQAQLHDRLIRKTKSDSPAPTTQDPEIAEKVGVRTKTWTGSTFNRRQNLAE